jgi:hypothetical protein
MDKLSTVVLYMSILFMGVVIGNSLPERDIFYPWYDDGIIRVGDKVRYHPALTQADYYNSCTYIRVISIKNVGQDRLAWVVLQDCHFPSGYEKVATDVIDTLNLLKEKVK